MSATIKKLIVLTSGGDSPGMNAGLRAVVRTALHNQVEVYGAESGFSGLVHKKLIPLHSRSVANCIQRGGTILKSGRYPEFEDPKIRAEAIQFMREQSIDAFVVLGGNGSLAGAALLHEESSIPFVGIPCTIDNDVSGTEYCIGFDTACNTALQAIDKIRDTAFSLERNFLIEVMGRSTGFIAVNVGIAGGAEVITIPEFPLSTDSLIEKIRYQHDKKMASIIVVAEANEPGHSFDLAKTIKAKTGIDYRVCVLGHTQRGGSPTVKDRLMGSLMGSKAVEALLDGYNHHMTAVVNGKIVAKDHSDRDQTTHLFTDENLLRINEIICGK